MSDDKNEGPKSSVSDRNWILWMTAVVLAAILIFEFIQFWGQRDDARAAPAAPENAAPMAPAPAPDGSAAPGGAHAPNPGSSAMPGEPPKSP